ncbi:MAG: Hsp20/alpha crystallin family protein [Candidatus Dormibacteraeota bacterium]|nr:Hsp20/alpha crystallin family protein [Candidatus Dormibacteraeota bacterium]
MSAMIPFRPFADILTLDRRLGSVFDGAWTGFPRVDVKDAEDHLEIVAEVPGVKAENVEVTVENGVLSIAAKADQTQSEDRNGYVWRERRQQSLQRAFRLPRGTAPEQVEASLENGLLTVSIKKAPAAAPAKIAVKSGPAELPAETQAPAAS